MWPQHELDSLFCVFTKKTATHRRYLWSVVELELGPQSWGQILYVRRPWNRKRPQHSGWTAFVWRALSSMWSSIQHRSASPGFQSPPPMVDYSLALSRELVQWVLETFPFLLFSTSVMREMWADNGFKNNLHGVKSAVLWQFGDWQTLLMNAFCSPVVALSTCLSSQRGSVSSAAGWGRTRRWFHICSTVETKFPLTF